MRDRDGNTTFFDAPGAGAVSGQGEGTFPDAINAEGAITGYEYDANFVIHGFVRAADGIITTVDVLGAGTGQFQGTNPEGINPEGEISGFYIDPNNQGHGFVRASDGAITTFDPPGPLSVYGGFGVGPGLDINPAGEIPGSYFATIAGNPFGGNYRGFVRNRDDSFATFDAATYPPCCIWTFAVAINSAGAVVGEYNDEFNVNHGFLRARNGDITGSYNDKNYVYHGFAVYHASVRTRR